MPTTKQRIGVLSLVLGLALYACEKEEDKTCDAHECDAVGETSCSGDVLQTCEGKE